MMTTSNCYLLPTSLLVIGILIRLSKCSTIAELDLSMVTPYAIVENGTLTNSSLARISNDNNSTQMLTSLLNSIRTSMLVDDDDSSRVEIVSQASSPPPPLTIDSNLSVNSILKATENVLDVTAKSKQTPVILLTTKTRSGLAMKNNVSLMTVPNVPREMAVSTVMNVLDLVSMYKDPSFSRGSSSISSSAHIGKFI